ncbi:MAG: carboxypeptidase-like regulatory domain-containing protein [Cyclobacteriaceae bacterium]
MIKYWIAILFLLSALLSVAQDDNASSETKGKILQFTGVVFAQDSNSVIPGVHIYVPKNGRGTTSNPYGFFSLPVREGDSIVFSSVGFKKSSYIIPKHENSTSLKLMVVLEQDVTFLDDVEVFPYPTEAMFKEAVLSLELPNQRQYDNLNSWLAREYMRSAYSALPSSANANAQYYMELQKQAIQNRYQNPSNNLLNPFAWAKFIKSLKEK